MPIIYASRYLGISEVLFSVELYPAGEPVEHIGNIQVLYLSLSVREDLKLQTDGSIGIWSLPNLSGCS